MPPSSRLTLERPKKAGFGDYATNAAMLLAPVVGAPPRDVAGQVGAELGALLGDRARPRRGRRPRLPQPLPRPTAGTPPRWPTSSPPETATAPARRRCRSRSSSSSSRANPTGPLTAASGRHAAFGDALSRLLEFAGNAVEREFYVNDAGSQVAKLGESIKARARGEDVPEGGYQGEYVEDLAAQIPGAADADPDELAQQGIALLLERNRATMEAYRVTFDHWFAEHTLYEGEPNARPARLRAARGPRAPLPLRGRAVAAHDATRATTRTACSSARAASRRTSPRTSPTTRRSCRRGYDRLINVFGADHHGYIGRMKAAFAALGTDPGPARDPHHAVRARRLAAASARRCPSGRASSSRSTT